MPLSQSVTASEVSKNVPPRHLSSGDEDGDTPIGDQRGERLYSRLLRFLGLRIEIVWSPTALSAYLLH